MVGNDDAVDAAAAAAAAAAVDATKLQFTLATFYFQFVSPLIIK